MKIRNTPERFWSFTKNDEKGSDCKIWTSTSHRKHGLFHFNGKMSQAHRVAWTLSFGAIPKKLWVLHKCGNGLCVNPGHLYLGDREANTRDAVANGEMAKGEKNGYSKLKEMDISIILRMRKEGRTLKEIGEIFGVSGFAISQVCLGKAWGHAQKNETRIPKFKRGKPPAAIKKESSRD